ncbi:MAG: PRC-barrel domain-containing protein [Methanoculleaceae archaeon]
MQTHITELFGLPVYTDRATYVGQVDDVIIDVAGKKLDALAVGNLSREIGEVRGYRGIRIPYRLIRAIGDIVIIRHIPAIFHSPSTSEE